MLDILGKLHSLTMRSNTMDVSHAMSPTSARDTQQKSHDQAKLSSHQPQHSERKIDRAQQILQEGVMTQQRPEDRDLHMHPSMSMAIDFEAQTNLMRSQLEQRYNEILERKEREWGDAYARLEQELATAQDSFKRCQADLWQLQPLPQVTDTEILNDFDELCYRVASWIDGEIAAAEKFNRGSKEQTFFQDGGNKVVASWMNKFSNFGEYYIKHIIHLFLYSTIFSNSTYLVGLPPDTVALLQVAEQTMPNLTPPRGEILAILMRFK